MGSAFSVTAAGLRTLYRADRQKPGFFKKTFAEIKLFR
jgi:hypothetical protein